MDIKINLLWETHQILADQKSEQIIDKESIIISLKEIETKKKQELFKEWKQCDNLQNHIRFSIYIDQSELDNLNAKLSCLNFQVQKKVIEHQKILVVLMKHQLSFEQSKLDELLFHETRNIISNNPNISIQTLIDEHQIRCAYFQKVYDKSVINLSKNQQYLESLTL
jgi:NhaP-type Na+/H+ and K+/H+ antiporter